MRWRVPRPTAAVSGLLILAALGSWQSRVRAATGPYVPALAGFDQMVTRFLADHHLPGAAVAVTKNGRLVYARAFGLADTEHKAPVLPTSLFRIASISKPLTAIAVLQLVEQGKLTLADSVFDILKITPHLENGKKVDPRLRRVTVLQCLQHTGGWDREKSYDPMFIYRRVARSLKIKLPLNQSAIIRYTWGNPLDFNPGERYAYSNFGYCVLGRVIEKVSGLPYEQYVRRHVLAPIGIQDMCIGKTLLTQRAPHEVRYYPPDSQETARSVVPPVGKLVPEAYGAWSVEVMDSHGGWIASAIDLVRFAAALEEPQKCKLLKPATLEIMFAPPPGAPGHNSQDKPKRDYYACGWNVQRVKGGRNLSHNGGLPGTSTVLMSRSDGVCWAVLFNASTTETKDAPATLIEPLMTKAIDAIKAWPAHDLSAASR